MNLHALSAPRVTTAEKAMSILDHAMEATNARQNRQNSGLAIQQLTARPCQPKRRRARRVSTAPATAHTSTLSAPMAHTVQKDLSTRRLAHLVTSDRAEQIISISTLVALDVEKEYTCQNIRIDAHVENVATQNSYNKKY